ncbi:MAG: InlB B-repeat-containing protein, partial [Oscillospiraceae bacterium]|nr:InlB B-repeat-containing protein [Oscillospiraceae bacterium]
GYVVSAEQRYNVSTDKYYATLTLISEDGKISTKTVDDVQNYSSVSMLNPDYGVGKLDSWRGAFVSYELNDDGVISIIDTCDEYGCPYDVKNTFDYSYGQPAQGLYLVNTYGLRGDVLQFYDTDSDVDVKSTPAMSAQLSEKGCDIIAVDGDDYAGSMLSFISSNISYISQYDGIWTNGDGAGNAVIYINEDGEIEKIFSFTDDEYSVISYDLNGGEGSIPSFTKRTGTNVALSTAIPTRENYTFKGWAEAADATDAEYQPGGLYDGDADATLYAVWEANKYTVTYLVDGEEYKSYELAYGEAITPEAEPEKSGYIFSGWSEIPETMPAEDVTITGTFEEIEIVDAAGVELNKTTISLTEGKTETLTATVLPAGATNKNVTWKSSNTNVAMVVDGVVTAKTAGTATITATTVDGGYKATCEVTVTESVDPMIYVLDTKGLVGKTVDVTISLKNNPGMAFLSFKVGYDSSAMTLQSVSGGAVFDASDIVPGDLSKNPYTVTASRYTVNTEKNGGLITLTFLISDTCEAGEYSIMLIGTESNDIDEEDVLLQSVNGKVTVRDVEPGDVNGDGTVNGKDLTRLGKHFAGWDVEIDEDAADVTGDGTVNGKDLTRLGKFFAGWDVELGK